jgi:hypothetical protein
MGTGREKVSAGWLAFQREFFGLASVWLLCRWMAMDHGQFSHYPFTDPEGWGITLGELDSGAEMHLLIEEWKRKQVRQDREEIRNYYGYYE